MAGSGRCRGSQLTGRRPSQPTGAIRPIRPIRPSRPSRFWPADLAVDSSRPRARRRRGRPGRNQGGLALGHRLLDHLRQVDGPVPQSARPGRRRPRLGCARFGPRGQPRPGGVRARSGGLPAGGRRRRRGRGGGGGCRGASRRRTAGRRLDRYTSGDGLPNGTDRQVQITVRSSHGAADHRGFRRRGRLFPAGPAIPSCRFPVRRQNLTVAQAARGRVTVAGEKLERRPQRGLPGRLAGQPRQIGDLGPHRVSRSLAMIDA
jgi:hypothetical protein